MQRGQRKGAKPGGGAKEVWQVWQVGEVCGGRLTHGADGSGAGAKD